jgi:Domain of unknown function (DUF6378)
MRARDVILQAADLLNGDRMSQHGDALTTHANIAALWSAYLGTSITARDAALMMVLLKVARTKSGRINCDDYVDAADYAGIAAELACNV